MPPLIIYHGGCWDGFCAAWLMRQRFPDAEFYPAQYGDPEPHQTKIAGRDVYILDFSYPRETLIRIYELSSSLIVLDHHKTAKEELEGLPYCVFSDSKSGARMTHEYIDRAFDGINGIGTSPHWLVLYTEDRDLWKWECTKSKEVNAWLRSHPLDFDLWDEISSVSIWSDEFDRFIAEGAAILRSEQQTINAKVSQSHVVNVECPDEWEGDFWTKWRVANTAALISETAAKLTQETGVGCCWFELPSGDRIYSLRANAESNIDVSQIAKAFGGGGHAKAAGFKRSKHPWSV